MITYLLRRSGQGLLVLLFASIILYALLNLTTGGPLADIYAQPFKTLGERQAAIAAAIKRYGMDKPIYIRYLLWLYSWEPAHEGDPDYLLAQLASDEAEYANASTLLGQEIATLPRRISQAEGNLAACQNLFSGDNLGRCLSVPRNGGILTGNWGNSWKVSWGTPVFDLIVGRGAYSSTETGATIYHPAAHWSSPLANTFVLMAFSLILSLVIAFPIGIYSAVRQYSTGDYLVTLLSFCGIAIPTFWFALVLVIIGFQFRSWGLPYPPTEGIVDDATNLAQYTDIGIRLKHLILPVMVLSLTQVAGWSRFLRSAMLEVLRLDYVRTAWAKGLPQRTVILKHALRNALLPMITLIGLAIPGMFGGAILAERVFSYQGMGLLYFRALSTEDWPMVMAMLVISAVLVVVGNMLADVAYALTDPRIRYS